MKKTLLWETGTWTNAPLSTCQDGDTLKVTAKEGSDFWKNTLYGFDRSSGHALLANWEDSEAIEVTFQLASFNELYDQAGIMLYQGPEQWIKAGIEINDNIPQLAVVVTNGYSDWSLSAVPDWVGEEVTLRASRMNDAVIIRARTEAHGWRTVRVAPFPYKSAKQAGPFLCSPTRVGFEVTFTRWVTTMPDADLHIDPPM